MVDELGRAPLPGLFARFTVPMVATMLFQASQGVADGLLVGRFVGPEGVAAVNIVMPLYTLTTAVCMVLGCGTQARVAHLLGAGCGIQARRALYIGILTTVLFAAASALLLNLGAEHFLRLLGAEGSLHQHAADYVRGLMPWMGLIGCFCAFDYMLRGLAAPRTATLIASAAIVGNIALTLTLTGVLHLGTFGAGLGTGTALAAAMGAQCVVLRQRCRNVFTDTDTSSVHESPSDGSGATLWRILYNGASEGLAELSWGITLLLINHTLLRLAGPQAVAAYAIVSFIIFFGLSVLIGVATGSITIIGYNHGAGMLHRVRGLVAWGAGTNLAVGLLFLTLLLLASEPLIRLFVPDGDQEIVALAVRAARIVCFVFLFDGANLLASAYFTAIGQAGRSLLVSASRGLVLRCAAIALLPLALGLEGVWLAFPLSEALTLAFAAPLVGRSLKENTATAPRP